MKKTTQPTFVQSRVIFRVANSLDPKETPINRRLIRIQAVCPGNLKEIQTIETCFLGNEKGNSLYINPLEGYIHQPDKNARNRKPAISIEEDPSPEPATPEDSPDFPNENSDMPKTKHSSSNSASDGAPNERLNDLSPRRQGQGRGNSKPNGAMNGVPNIQGTDPTKPPAFNLDTDSEDDLLSDGTPLTPLHISEEEDNNERNKASNRPSSATIDRIEEKNRKNAAKETNEPKPLDPSELFPVINRNKDKNKEKENDTENEKGVDKDREVDKNLPAHDKPYGSSSSSDGGSDDNSSTTTEGCDSPNTLATLDAELGSDPTLNAIVKNKAEQKHWNERGSPELRLPPYPQPAAYLAGRQGRPLQPGPDGRQPRPHGPGGPPMRGHGPRGPPGRDPGQRGPPREPGARGYPPRDHRGGHGPRGPGQRDPRDPRNPRDTRDPRDPRNLRDPRDPRDQRDPREMRDPRDQRDLPRDPRDPRDPGARPPPQRDPRDHRDPRGPGPRDPGARPGPRELGSKGPAPREPGSRVPPQREPGPRDPMGRGPAPRPPENKGPAPQPNIPPFPVFSNFYDTPPIEKGPGLNLDGRNQGPIIS